MRPNRCSSSLLAVAAVFCVGLTGTAAEPPAPPPTLWSFLGIPQASHKLHDGFFNKKGNHPGLEKKPPLKKIADVANLESPNPAIKAAAKIKTEEDLAPQKIKAIKYLATVGCGCYPDVRDALLAALEDCTEEVRLAAAEAFEEAAGCPCQFCNRSGCCSPAVIKKLEDMAHGLDDQGCPKEASARVRAAAERALNACQMVTPATPTEAPRKKELPVEIAPDAAAPEAAPAPPADRSSRRTSPLRG